MITDEPLFLIEVLPYILDCDPDNRLLVAGFDSNGAVAHRAWFPITTHRPFDDAALDILRVRPEASSFVVVCYSENAVSDVEPFMRAAETSSRPVPHVLWAGRTRWRSLDCQRVGCCPSTGNRYDRPALGHPDYHPQPRRGEDPRTWRLEAWGRWQDAIIRTSAGAAIDPWTLSELARSLFDIPLRDAMLAQSARDDGAARPAITTLLRQAVQRSPLATASPAHTCSAAMSYLDGDLVAADTVVNAVLAVEEYSLARLLRNGLDMHAPASLLARSFSHFHPTDLLAA